jgi:3-oxoadipate enol-lactonase
MHDYAQDALAVIDSLNWQSAHVIGESFGGMTALHLALNAPERVRSLTVSSATSGGTEHASFDISQFLALSREDAAAQSLCLQDTRNELLKTSNAEAFAEALAQRQYFEHQFSDPSIVSGGYARLLTARSEHDCTALVHKLTNPTTVIAGKYDKQARPEAQEQLAKLIPSAQFHLFDAGHGVLFSEPKATQCALTAIKEFESNLALLQ